MEINRLTLPPCGGPGEVTTFYSFESGAARSIALADSAVLLASRKNATTPVLMIDWDTEAPGLHHLFPSRDERYEQARRGGAGVRACSNTSKPAASSSRPWAAPGATTTRSAPGWCSKRSTGKPMSSASTRAARCT